MTVPAVSLVTLLTTTELCPELAMSTLTPATWKLWALGRSLGTYLEHIIMVIRCQRILSADL